RRARAGGTSSPAAAARAGRRRRSPGSSAPAPVSPRNVPTHGAPCRGRSDAVSPTPRCAETSAALPGWAPCCSASRRRPAPTRSRASRQGARALRSPPPLRLLMVTPRYLPETGGAEIHVHEVATRLADAGVDVTVLTTDRHGTLPARER